MIIALLGPPSPAMTQTIEALGFLLAALVGGTENAMRPQGPGSISATETCAAYGVADGWHGFFTPEQYLANYPDVGAALGDDRALWHFYFAGWHEGRTFLPLDGPKLEHMIFAAEAPEPEVVDKWRTSNAIRAVVLDEPVATAQRLCTTAAVSEREAVRRVSRSFALAEEWLHAEGLPLVAPSRRHEGAILDGLEKIAMACGLANTRPWFEYYFRDHAKAQVRAGDGATATSSAIVNGALVTTMLPGFANALDRDRIETTTWPACAFVRAGAPDKTAEDEIELEGPARFLAAGPFMHLPKGRWISESIFSSTKNFNGCKFAVDMYQPAPVDRVLVGHKFVLPEEGVFALSLDFDVLDARAPVENRYQLDEGLIGGIFRLHETRLRRA